MSTDAVIQDGNDEGGRRVKRPRLSDPGQLDDNNALSPRPSSRTSSLPATPSHKESPIHDFSCSPTMADFFANLPSQELDFLPSSDPANDDFEPSSLITRGKNLFLSSAAPMREDEENEDEYGAGHGRAEGSAHIEESVANPVAEHSITETVSQSPSPAAAVDEGSGKQNAEEVEEEEEEDLDYYDLHQEDADPFAGMYDPNAVPGFVTAAKKPVAISSTALARGRALFVESDSAEPIEAPPLPAPRFLAQPNFNTPRPHHGVKTASHLLPAVPTFVPSSPSYHTASQEDCSTVTPKIDQKATKQLFDFDFDHVPLPSTFTDSSLPATVTGFATAGGRTFRPPSAAAMAKAAALVSGEAPPSETSKGSPLKARFPASRVAPVIGPLSAAATSSSPPPAPRLTAASADVFSGAPVPDTTTFLGPLRHLKIPSSTGPSSDGSTGELSGPARSPLQQVNSVRSATASPAVSPTRESPIDFEHFKSGAGVPPSPPKQLGAKSPVKVSAVKPSPFRPLAFRSPLISRGAAPTGANASLSTSASPRPQNADNASGTPRKAAPALRRLNVSMTPRPRPQTSHKFSTPFKNGVRPAGLTPTGLPGAGRSPGFATQSPARSMNAAASKAAGRDAKLNTLAPVFDLASAPPRTSLKDAGFRPGTRHFDELLHAGLPVELLEMTAVSSNSFVFECGRGEEQALAALQSAGAMLAGLPWVKNHWSLIVWKLACLVRSRVEYSPTYWRWERAVEQLKYRYEREINNAQRSCIKRIQERDSSASLAMVLCVSQIRWGSPEGENIKPDQPLVIVGIELTDGWYRIRASVDGTLKSALERHKIVVGAKLKITGARLDCPQDTGTDVLDALKTSSLIVSGNSTALAPWHAKLGFIGKTFYTNLDSITPLGGVASLLTVIIDRVHPCGFLDMKNPRDGTWNQDEERERADAWESGRALAEARLAHAQDGVRGEWDVIYELLQDAAQVLPYSAGDVSTTGAEEEDADEILERLESSTKRLAIIRALSPRQIHECYALAARYVEDGRRQKIDDLQKDLQRSFPPRDIRSFCVVVVRNGNGDDYWPRTAQLTVWDAAQHGPGFFEVGRSYLVTNVVPKGTWKRASLEISLTTRRDSKWRKLDS